MKINSFTHKDSGMQHMAWLLIVVFSFQVFLPSYSFAGGPTQPEVSGFTPIGFSDMVDPFTGDFTYNIPLMDIEGYPINIAYNAGIGMDQEASWVGLGWNLNVGSVVRNMRGLPDDFSGDEIIKTTNMKPNRSYSLEAKFSTEVFGKKMHAPADNDSVNSVTLTAAVGIEYNNYNGWGVDYSFGPSFNFNKATGHTMTAGFSLSGSSENGASFAPSLSYESKLDKDEKNDRGMAYSVGSSFNSRAGLSYVSYGAGIKKHIAKDATTRQVMSAKRLQKGAPGSYNFGLASYNPSSGPSMKSVAVNGSWKFGTDAIGVDGTGTLTLSFSSQWIPAEDRTISNPAYGYFHLQQGQENPKALLDFNRDKEGSFTVETNYLPSAYLTYDLYSLNAQGISGSYRGFRSDIGYVFDPEVKTTSTNAGAGIEFGMGSLAKTGIDANYNHMSSVTGGWDGSLNHATNSFKFRYGKVAMQEANEASLDSDPVMGTQLNGSEPLAFKLNGYAKFVGLQNELYHNSTLVKSNPVNQRIYPYKRNQLMQFLTHSDLADGFGIEPLHPNIHVGAKDHHVGQVIQTGTDGRRYVFGIAAYNHFQEEVTFATGTKINNDPGLVAADPYNGLIDYPPTAASEDNNYGLDNYYSSTQTPAYAHSYLLTSVLSDDYIDADSIQGPSENDLGTYVKFSYAKEDNYEWRTPMGANQAFRNEGMKTDPTDDKASFVYGQKDLWYVTAVETKNYVAVFELEDRADGFGVSGRCGGVDSSNQSMKLIRKISLYNRPDYEKNPGSAVAIQEVHFTYSYELCTGFPGNPGTFPVPSEDEAGRGKLTLKQIYFTYQGSNRMKYSPYQFAYNTANPSYNMKAVDRWGNYKAIAATGTEIPTNTELNNADFPYTDQNPAHTNTWVAAWSMSDIGLPSGGRIHVDYESDDYQYVQHKKAMRMFQIVSTEQKVDNPLTNFNAYEVHSVSDGTEANKKIYFKLEPGHEDIDEYVKEGQYLYFRCLTDFLDELGDANPMKYEYVSGYGSVDTCGVETWNGQQLGWIKFFPQKMKDAGNAEYSPITKSAIQFARLHLSRYINDAGQNDPSDDNSEQGLLAFAQAAYNGLAAFSELFTGPNMSIYNKERGREIVTNKSWIRLQDPDGTKLGGGIRVKRILMSDEWSSMTGNAMNTFSYGQEFSYQTADGKSSGVASYEPQAGGDENPWRQPETYKNKLHFSPDQNLYQEDPILESQFPSPVVGYSRVEIRDLKRKGVVRTATGKVVKEFFTAKDFPTIVNSTVIDPKIANSFLPLLPKYQYLSASQGFSIEMNDMHGKPRKESVYAQNMADPISTVEYFYQMQDLNASLGTHQLTNMVKVVKQDGTISYSEIGVKREALADFRKSTTSAFGGAGQGNINLVPGPGIPVPVPTIWPSIDISDNEFKSATLTKVTNRFGVLEKTVADQDGSKVDTRNLAYDAETGEVLATQTTTNFNDKVYSFNYPAYWAYDQLGPAYQNVGEQANGINFNASGFAAIANADKHYVEGDELMIRNFPYINNYKGWVRFVAPTGITVIDKEGNPITVSNAMVEVIRSGRKNKQVTSMASITTLADPLPSLSSNAYKQVLNAGAIEYVQDWKIYCHCYVDEALPATANPFILGTKGNWRPVKSYTHLSERTQSKYDNNTNIRKDGVFTSYTPFYRLGNGTWSKQGQNWTFVSEVTQFSPNGMTLETRDALQRSSASLFGFNNTLTTAVGANTSLKQLAFASFEDDKYTNCMDQQFIKDTDNHVTSEAAHTGRNSIRVPSGGSVGFSVNDLSCAPTGCTLGLVLKESGYALSGGTAPIQLDVDVISGDVDATLLPNGSISFSGNVSAAYTVRLTLTDATGCQYTKTITKP